MSNLTEDEINTLKWKIKSAFAEVSDNYKQKLLYNLLNASKTGNQGKYFEILLRAMNANLKDNKEFQDFANELNEKYNKINNTNFEKFANSIILGIMASSKNKTGGN